jgi:hypothetical protein
VLKGRYCRGNNELLGGHYGSPSFWTCFNVHKTQNISPNLDKSKAVLILRFEGFHVSIGISVGASTADEDVEFSTLLCEQIPPLAAEIS